MIEYQKQLKEMVACVSVDNEPIGSAFLIDEWHVVTALHVLNREPDVSLQFFYWQTYEDAGTRNASLVWQDPSGMDVAILKLNRECPAQVDILPWGALPKSGDHWYTFGFPKGVLGGHTCSKDNIVEDPQKIIDKDYSPVIQLSSAIAKDDLGGFSGSPCIVEGEVVGILATQLLRDEKPLFDALYGIPVALLKNAPVTPPSPVYVMDLPKGMLGADWETYRQQLRDKTNLKASQGKFIADKERFTNISGVFDSEHLLALHGSFGRGKTRLAEEMARRVARQYEDGVWVVALEHVAVPEGVVPAIAAAMNLEVDGAVKIGDLVNRIGRGSVLLVLDGCERFIDQCTTIGADLINRCPGLKVILTTQDSLQSYYNFHVPVLKYPAAKVVPDIKSEIEKYEAVRFLLYQASRFGTRLNINNASAAAEIAELCRLVQGVPLELMLVAGSLISTDAKTMIGKLKARDASAFVHSDKNLSREAEALRVTLEVCSSQLDKFQRELLVRLSVFRGPFTEEAIRAIIGDSFRLSELNDVVNRSFIERLRDDDNRLYYCLFNANRQFFWKQAKEQKLENELQNLHLTHYLQTVSRLNKELKGGEQSASLNQLEKEHENILAAIDFSWNANRVNDGAMLASQMRRFWFLRGYYDSGRVVLETAISKLPKNEYRLLALVLADAGILARMQSKYDLALKYLNNAIEIAKNEVYPDIEGTALNAKGILQCRRREWEQAKETFDSALDIAIRIEDKNLQAWVYNGLTNVAIAQQESSAASQFARKSFNLKQQLGDKRGMAMSQEKMGQLQLKDGHIAMAKTLFEQALTTRRELGYRSGIAETLMRLASIAIKENDFSYASECLLESLKAILALQDRSRLAALLEVLEDFAKASDELAWAENLAAARNAVLTEIGAANVEYTPSAAEFMLGQAVDWESTVIEAMKRLERDVSVVG